MIGEPVMGGGGGILVPPADYWPRVRELLTRNGILLIADEVVTAFGRIGDWFDSAGRGMSPDIMVPPRDSPAGMCRSARCCCPTRSARRISAGEASSTATPSWGTRWRAPWRSCLEIIEGGSARPGRLIGEWFRTALAPAADLPAVGDVRVEGTLAALEIVADRDTRQPMGWTEVAIVAGEVRRRHGVIVRPYGPTWCSPRRSSSTNAGPGRADRGGHRRSAVPARPRRPAGATVSAGAHRPPEGNPTYDYVVVGAGSAGCVIAGPAE